MFLRVWQDKKQVVNGKPYIMITHHDKHAHDEHNYGYDERNMHVQMIKDGAPCYMVMCLAKDVNAIPRDIKSFNKEDLFLGAEMIELDGDYWLGYTARVPVDKMLTSGKTSN